MAAKLIILSTLPLLWLSLVLQVVMPMPHTPAVEATEEHVLMIYSTGKNQVRVKNGSKIYSIPTVGDMRLAAYDPKHAELYLTFRSGPNSPEEVAGEAGTIYRAKLSDNKTENAVRVFANPSHQEVEADAQYSPKWLAYDDVDEQLYFSDQRGLASIGRDLSDRRNVTKIHDLLSKDTYGYFFALNPSKGTLYLTAPGSGKFPSIQKGPKDGVGDFVKIIEEGHYLTVDADSGYLFYIVAEWCPSPDSTKACHPGVVYPISHDIMRSDLDGKNPERVHTLQMDPASFLQVAGDRIYWAEGIYGERTVFGCNKFSGKDLREYELDGLESDRPFGPIPLLVVSR